MTANTRVRGPRRVSRSERVVAARSLVISGKRVSGTGRVFAARCEAASTRFRAGRQPDHLAATGLGEEAVPSVRRQQSKEPLFPRGDGCCTRQQTGDFCADPFLSIPAVRQLSAGKGVGRSASSSGSQRGEEGGKIRNNGWTQGAREARRRRRCIAIVRRSAPRRRRARETVRRRRKHRGGDVRPGQRAVSGSAQSARLVWRRR